MTIRTLTAFNTATASENKIHDDTVASRFGFTGGLVPGVDVFAYLAHMPMAKWGRDWLTSGWMLTRGCRGKCFTCREMRPVAGTSTGDW